VQAKLSHTNAGLRVLFGALLTGSWAAALLVFPAEWSTVVLVSAFLLLLGFVLCGSRELDVLSPLTVVALSFFVYCFGGFVSFLLSGRTYFYAVDITSQVDRFFILSTLGLAGLVVGWRLGATRKTCARVQYSETALLVSGLLFAVAAAASFFLYYFLSGTFVDRVRILPTLESRSEVITIGYLLQGLDLCVPGLALLAASQRTWVRRLGVVLGAVLMVFALTTGFRANVVKIVMPLAVMHYLRVGRRPFARTCLVAVMVALIVFAGIGMVRSGNATFAEAFTSSALFDPDLLLSDLNTVQAMAMVLAKVPSQVDYLLGESLFYVPTHVLPRSFFPNKGVAPEVQLVWDVTDKYAGFAIPIFGLFYLNLGYPGAAGGMLLVGLVLSRVYHRYLVDSGNPRLQALLTVTVVLAYLTFPRHSLVQILTQCVYCLSPFLILEVLRISRESVVAWTSSRNAPSSEAFPAW
jgi:oligosaccharide repeat unit polymerase